MIESRYFKNLGFPYNFFLECHVSATLDNVDIMWIKFRCNGGQIKMHQGSNEKATHKGLTPKFKENNFHC